MAACRVVGLAVSVGGAPGRSLRRSRTSGPAGRELRASARGRLRPARLREPELARGNYVIYSAMAPAGNTEWSRVLRPPVYYTCVLYARDGACGGKHRQMRASAAGGFGPRAPAEPDSLETVGFLQGRGVLLVYFVQQPGEAETAAQELPLDDWGVFGDVVVGYFAALGREFVDLPADLQRLEQPIL